jgi:hypothetical protein
LVLVAAVIALLWLIFRGLIHWFNHQTPGIRTAIIGALALVLVPLVTYFTNRSIDQHRSVNDALRLHKLELYEGIFKMLMRNFEADIPGKPKPTQDELAQFISDTKPALLTWGSNQVNKTWGLFWRDAATPRTNWQTMIALEDLIKTIRKDLGHRSYGLAQGDLARVFVTDLDDVRPGGPKAHLDVLPGPKADSGGNQSLPTP